MAGSIRTRREVPLGGRAPVRNDHRSGAGFDLGDRADGNGGADDVVAAAVLTGDGVEVFT